MSTDEPLRTGRQLGLFSCHTCGRVSEAVGKAPEGAAFRCPRCDTTLRHRNPRGLERSWAYTWAALMLYLPANLLPVMSTVSLTGTESHTILGGIHELWLAGDWGLALIVFIASVGVPIVKLVSIVMLLMTAGRNATWCSRERATLYRWIEAVGHWSMLDVFVVVLLVGMIHFGPFAGVKPESGLLAFGAVVVLTILSVSSFDPRLIWPDPDDNPPASAPPTPHE